MSCRPKLSCDAACRLATSSHGISSRLGRRDLLDWCKLGRARGHSSWSGMESLVTGTCMAWYKLVHMQGSCKGRDVHGSFMPTTTDGDGLVGAVGELELTCQGALRVTSSGEQGWLTGAGASWQRWSMTCPGRVDKGCLCGKAGAACAFGTVGRQRGGKSGSSWG